jgi:hypothetical protein
MKAAPTTASEAIEANRKARFDISMIPVISALTLYLAARIGNGI